MKQPNPATGREQPFAINETFLSVTDPRGVITDGNAVFSRTSGYSLTELRGRPHSVIRHGDMPRGVFHLLWSALEAGKSFAGYVKNHAKNGNHYWVFAVVTPIAGGHLSVRMKPSTPVVETVAGIYARLLAEEARLVASGETARGAMQQSARSLVRALEEKGFSSYAAFSHAAMTGEIRSRDGIVAARGLRLFPEELSADSSPELCEVYRRACSTYAHVNRLFSSLHAIVRAADGIRGHREAVKGIAHEFRLSALNAHVTAHPLGEVGETISTVALFLNEYAKSLTGNVTRMSEHIGLTLEAVGETASTLSTARLQLEMMLTLLAENAEAVRDEAEAARRSTLLSQVRAAFCASVTTSLEALAELETSVPAVARSNAELRKDIITLQVAQIAGMTESARLRHAEAIAGMFGTLREQIERAKGELGHLSEVVGSLTAFTGSTPQTRRTVRASLDQWERSRVA